MKKGVILFFILIVQIAANAASGNDQQIQHAKFRIIKATVEFLASDKETFKDVRESKCDPCTDYNGLLVFVEKNKIKKADLLINKWKTTQIDTTYSNWKNSIEKFKNMVVGDISTGAKVKRKTFPNYNAYSQALNSIIGAVSIAPTDALTEEKALPETHDEIVEPAVTEPYKIMSETDSHSASFFSFLPDLSKDMAYVLIFLLLAGIVYFIWTLRHYAKLLGRDTNALNELVRKNENKEWELKKVQTELKNVTLKLSTTEQELTKIQEDIKAEAERNKRLAATPKIKVKAKPAPEVPVPHSPTVKYARYADQGDGFSDQELLDEEDSETIFELTFLTPQSASFKISTNTNAQRYALSNSPYFLGKTSQYDSFPSGNSLIKTDQPGELKLQGNKWLIIKPIKISFS